MSQTKLSFADQIYVPPLLVNDANAGPTARQSTVGFTALTATRVVTLPSAADYAPHLPFTVYDETGNCSPTIKITVVPASGQTIMGLSSVSLTRPGQRVSFYSNGSNKWTVEGNVDEVLQNLISSGPVANLVAGKLSKAGGDVITGQLSFGDNVGGTIASRSGGGAFLQVATPGTDGTGAAAMTFLRQNSYASWFGLDTDNEFKRGGWSDGAASYKFWTEKNFNPATYISKNSANGFHATAYGYVTGNGADQTAALQAAVNAAAAAGGGTVFLPPGDAYFDGTLDVSNANNVWIVGSGHGTRMISRSTSAVLISAAGGLGKTLAYFGLKQIKFDCNLVRNATPLLNFNVQLYSCVFEDIIANGWGSLMYVAGFVHLFLWRWNTQQAGNPPAGGYCWQLGATGNGFNAGANCSIVGCLLRGNSGPNAANNSGARTNGVVIGNVEALTTKYLDVGNFDCNVFAVPDFAARNMFFEDTYFDASYYGPSFEVSGTAVCERWNFSNCWFATSGGLANPSVGQPLLYISNGNVVQTFLFSGCRFFNAGGAAVQINGANGMGAQFTGCFFHDSGTQKAGKDGNGTLFTYAHIQTTGVNANALLPALSGCSFLRCTSGYSVIYSGGVMNGISGCTTDSKAMYLASSPPATITGPMYIQKSSSGLTYKWDIDSSAGTYTIPNGNALLITPGSGMIIVTDQASGSVGVFICGGAQVALVSQNIDFFGTAGANNGRLNLTWDTTNQRYVVINFRGGPVTCTVMGFLTRPNY